MKYFRPYPLGRNLNHYAKNDMCFFWVEIWTHNAENFIVPIINLPYWAENTKFHCGGKHRENVRSTYLAMKCQKKFCRLQKKKNTLCPMARKKTNKLNDILFNIKIQKWFP